MRIQKIKYPKNVVLTVFTILTIILGFYNPGISQSPSVELLKSAGGDGRDQATGVGLDNSGNTYITGMFGDQGYFDDTPVIGFGSVDIFLAKYDNLGEFVWIKLAGDAGQEWAHAIATDGDGNSVITGLFYGKAEFDNTTLTSAGNDDLFITKYDTDGNLLWVRQAGGLGSDQGYGICYDGSGNTIVTGFFSGVASFGGISVTSVGHFDIFIAKYDPWGNILWVKNAGSSAMEIGNGVATDNSGNIYATGHFHGNVTFGNVTLTSAGSDDIYAVKYDPEGNLIWGKGIGGSGSEVGSSIAVDMDGKSAIVGAFSGTAVFGSETFTSLGATDYFIVLLDELGEVIWAKTDGTNKTDSQHSITYHEKEGWITCGYQSFEEDYIAEMFVTAYDNSGGIRWKISGYGESIKRPHAVTTNGEIIAVTGRFKKNLQMCSEEVISVGGNDLFVGWIYTNQPPQFLEPIPTFSVEEGSTRQLEIPAEDPDNDPLTYTWDLNNDGEFEAEGQEVTFASTDLDDHPAYLIKVKATDTGDLFAIVSSHVEITNADPVVGVISAPIDPTQTGADIQATAPFIDPGIHDMHTANWNWGDECVSDGAVVETNGSGTVTGTHIYLVPGVYTVTLTVTDDDGGQDKSTFQYVVIYDPAAGFVTGGGWMDSPEGAYSADPILTGKASFGFVSKYKKGADIPDGNTQFNFKVAAFKFHSTEYQWLVIAGSHAKFKGFGTINGSGDYGFMLTATDGELKGDGIDRFRIKIWEKDVDETVVYDNQMGDADDRAAVNEIRSGSIVIHKKGLKKNARVVDGQELEYIPSDYRLHQNFPNPFNPETRITYELPEASQVTLKIYNNMGKEINTLAGSTQEMGVHSVFWNGRNEAGQEVSSGIYYIMLRAGEFVATTKALYLK